MSYYLLFHVSVTLVTTYDLVNLTQTDVHSLMAGERGGCVCVFYTESVVPNNDIECIGF